jgi:hypothetical protein
LIRWWLGQKNRNHNHHNNNKVFDGLDWATRHNLTEPRRTIVSLCAFPESFLKFLLLLLLYIITIILLLHLKYNKKYT